MFRFLKFTVLSLCLLPLFAISHPTKQSRGEFEDKFRQLNTVLPTPNQTRSASGEPGVAYWQQKVDYDINVQLDEAKRRITASQTVTYHNNSPHELRYLWLQLEQNRFKEDAVAERTLAFGGFGSRGPTTRAETDSEPAGISLKELRRQHWLDDNKVGYQNIEVTGVSGQPLKFLVSGTQMRIDLPEPVESKGKTVFAVSYAFNLLEENSVRARAGYENFPDDARKGGNDIFLVAQWFPRLQAYSDYEAWHNKEFLGRGEFTLEFGDYNVEITVPADHIVASTGELKNPKEVLTGTQIDRLKTAETADNPVFIVTADEALENEKAGTKKQKTWQFSAKNVRDFAWSSSRKFMWDAQGYKQDDDETPLVMAMSFYPKEGGDLWNKYSTAAVVHTMDVYSRFAFNYPYPTAQSVNGPVGGMEYPMITFNGPRTIWHDDGSRTYTLAEKRFLIGVIIHEIGHIYFPMTVNSDERQWTWMDEGINSFLDSIASREWDSKIPWGVEPQDIVDYMKSEDQVPIMTQSDSILQFGANAYAKPAVALNILREVILGRELFDFAFREFSQRWKFKRPTPADFFRTMEEASGVDLDWFWRGWFFSTDHVDISIDRVKKYRLDTLNPDVDFARDRKDLEDQPKSLFLKKNRHENRKEWVELNKNNKDFHDENDQFLVTNVERNAYKQLVADLDEKDRKALERAIKEDRNFYVLDFSNLGGLVMPILLEIEYKGGKKEQLTLPAEIWRRSPKAVSKLLVRDKEMHSVVIDPNWYTADVNIENNHYPREFIDSRMQPYPKEKRVEGVYRDLMHDIKTELVEPEIKLKKK